MSILEGDRANIFVTGFEPFGRYAVNSSWVAVRELERLWLKRNDSPPYSQSYKLETREIPVSYSYIDEYLQKIYEEIKPVLCIHVGVSSNKTVKLERYGRNTGYYIRDTEGLYPVSTQCIEYGPERLSTLFDLEYIQSLLKCTSSGLAQVEFHVSENAGQYVCDYIYYTSLYLAVCPVIFVHVPPLNDPYSPHQLGQALGDIINVLLMEMNR